ncbi:sugar ABC transporter substrate-binding protein [Demequina capsici]|uniref:Sugar ABC transporter substrate-binding protein n=1 Tax=Demequina capsici TaxID=3075620 RepID=A0AA96FAA4_9MICO|nr:sugar ABC transporter substrate-binding protein [Demequina sp. OYTSA14]WNM25630.1 sugar ABC transporter substrate-binding protein [Demequina sp. OYTSA14]
MSTIRHHLTRSAAGVSAGAILILVTACSSSDGGADASTSESASSSATASEPAMSDLPKTLVFSPIGLQIPAMQGLSDGVNGYGGSQGWEVIVQDPNLDPSTQVQQVTDVLESGRAGALWIIAIAPASMSDVLVTAQEKGVPVLINGVPADYGFDGAQAGISFDTIDYAAGGTALGEQTGKCINEKLGGTATVIYGESAAGTAGKEESDKAFLDALTATAPNATVVQNWEISDRAASQTDVGAVLQAHPDVNVVAAANDEGALGAIGAFKAAGKDLPCVTDFGGNDEVLGLVADGTMYATVALQFQDDMVQSFDTLVAMQADPTALGPVLTVPLKATTSEG